MKLLGKIPLSCYIACSGGKDSMMLLTFLLKGRRDVTVLHFNHKTEHGKEAELFLQDFCIKNNITLHIGSYLGDKQTEAAWREARYNFFSFFKDKPILMAQHLDDNIETYIMSDIKGTAKFIPYRRDNIIRPLLLSSREELDYFCTKYKVKWIEDPSNSSSDYDRNKVRNEIVPVLKQINPGLYKTFRNRCLERYKRDFLEEVF